MRFRFIGNGDNDPGKVTLAGVEFPKGEPVDVTSEWLIDKLKSNSHFEAVRGRPKKDDQDQP